MRTRTLPDPVPFSESGIPELPPVSWFDRFADFPELVDNLLAGLERIAQGLRPLTGHINTHALPSDKLAATTVTIPAAGGKTLRLQTNMPKGVACRVTIRVVSETPTDGVYVSAMDESTETASIGFRIEAGDGPVTINTRADLFVLPPTEARTVSYMVESWSA